MTQTELYAPVVKLAVRVREARLRSTADIFEMSLAMEELLIAVGADPCKPFAGPMGALWRRLQAASLVDFDAIAQRIVMDPPVLLTQVQHILDMNALDTVFVRTSQ
jgi:hypothetical protein